MGVIKSVMDTYSSSSVGLAIHIGVVEARIIDCGVCQDRSKNLC